MRSSTIKNADREVARARTDATAEQAHIDQLRERLAPVVDHAIRVARVQAAQAAMAATLARGWAAPRLGAAVERGRTAAAPRLEAAVEAAAERVVPAVDATRDRIVEDLLPRLVEAVHQAALSGAAAKTAAAESVSRTVEEAARSLADATPSAKARVRQRRRRTGTLLLALAAALVSGGVVAVWRRAKVRQAAAWEVPPTGIPATGTSTGGPAAAGSTMEVIAAAAGPSDAGVTAPSPAPVDEPTEPLADEPVATEPLADEPVATEPLADEPVATAEESRGTSEQGGTPSGPETIGIDTGLGEEPAAPPERRG